MIPNNPETRQGGENLMKRDIESVEQQTIDTIEQYQEVFEIDRNLDYTEIEQKLVEQINNYLEKSGLSGFVVGVSGGIDSAVVSTLLAKTGKPTTLLTLPIHQRENEVTRAGAHITDLEGQYDNVTSENIDLTTTFETMKQALPEIEDEEIVRYMAYVNTRSRLRAVSLYAIANEKNALVAGTGNKVEDYGIGFFTKFGDGAVDFSPIGNLLKTEVYKLAAHMGVREDILQAKPTDGLHPDGATDEDQIGCTYTELEWAMEAYDAGIRSKYLSGKAQEIMKIYETRHEMNAHKMDMPPIFEI